uniref:Uncharacterized protein n=1 Tax=Candidatus Kentrum sp. LFY TaxID=2126342 RepID=A0A450V0E6_9GAMM|nr:MAG: hypothetical protein BECKLFY1418B_GA0070995_11176 [Candidatus Kentron sp. LFY]
MTDIVEIERFLVPAWPGRGVIREISNKTIKRFLLFAISTPKGEMTLVSSPPSVRSRAKSGKDSFQGKGSQACCTREPAKILFGSGLAGSGFQRNALGQGRLGTVSLDIESQLCFVGSRRSFASSSTIRKLRGSILGCGQRLYRAIRKKYR